MSGGAVRIVLAADHNGVELKAHLHDWLGELGHPVEDLGTHGPEVVDYPPIVHGLCRHVLAGRSDLGIVVGGSGSGEAIACNKVPGIRATLCQDTFTAEIAAAHNNANVLVLGAKILTPTVAERVVAAWLSAPFKGGVHQRRLDMITALERGGSTDGRT